jgi:hypothetical protein
MWATAFALTKLTKAEEKRIVELVKQAGQVMKTEVTSPNEVSARS